MPLMAGPRRLKMLGSSALRLVDRRGLKLAVTGSAAGLFSGLLGVGGGILFVPALTLAVSLSQVQAEATSLLAIIPVALIGAVQQWRYGNVQRREGLTVGLLSAGGVAGGVAAANVVPQHAL